MNPKTLVALVVISMFTMAAHAQTVTVGSAPVQCGKSVDVPVTISSVSGLLSLEFDIGYTSAKLQPTLVTAGTLTSGFSVASNVTGTVVKVAMASGSPASGSGRVATIRFTAGASATGTVSLPISGILVNDVAKSGTAGAVTISCLKPPSAPTLKLPANNATDVAAPVKLQWDAVADAEEYQVYMGAPSAALIGSTTGTAMEVETATGTTYEWYVRARNAAGTGPASATRTFKTSGPFCATPGAPSIVAPGTSVSGSSFTVSWSSLSNTNEYLIEEAETSSFAGATSTTTTTTSVSFTRSVSAATSFYYRVRGRNSSDGCSVSGPASAPASVVVAPRPPIAPGSAVLVVVSSTPGGFGAAFRTSVQLHNPTSSVLRGRIVFHPAGSSGGDSDPSLAYELQPGQTISHLDLLPALGIASGVGSVDLLPAAGNVLPLFVTRVFNDAGLGGTSGLTLEALDVDDVLYAGQTAVLVAPMDPARARMNIGIRALSEGAAITARLRDRDGTVIATKELSYPAVYFIQTPAEVLMGTSLSADATLAFTVNAGSVLIYGSTTDNVTNDPSVQIARPID